MADKQVARSHYAFSKYMTKERWISIWHQVDQILTLNSKSILEVGPGPGLLKAILSVFDLKIETLDFDAELQPDHVGSATNLPFPENAYDLVCAFQILEHMPFSEAVVAFEEMVRVSSEYVLISLPDSRRTWFYHFHIPFMGAFRFNIPVPRLVVPAHTFDGQHHWELNKKGYGLGSVIASFSRQAVLVSSFRVLENSYHRFLLFRVCGQ